MLFRIGLKKSIIFAPTSRAENERLIRQHLSGSQEVIHRLPAEEEVAQDTRAIRHPQGDLLNQQALRHRLTVQPDERQQVPRQQGNLVQHY